MCWFYSILKSCMLIRHSPELPMEINGLFKGFQHRNTGNPASRSCVLSGQLLSGTFRDLKFAPRRHPGSSFTCMLTRLKQRTTTYGYANKHTRTHTNTLNSSFKGIMLSGPTGSRLQTLHCWEGHHSHSVSEWSKHNLWIQNSFFVLFIASFLKDSRSISISAYIVTSTTICFPPATSVFLVYSVGCAAIQGPYHWCDGDEGTRAIPQLTMNADIASEPMKNGQGPSASLPASLNSQGQVPTLTACFFLCAKPWVGGRVDGSGKFTHLRNAFEVDLLRSQTWFPAASASAVMPCLIFLICVRFSLGFKAAEILGELVKSPALS